MSNEPSTDTPDPDDANMGWVHDSDSGYRDPLWPAGKIPNGEGGWVDDTKLNRISLKLYRSDNMVDAKRVRGKGVLLQLGDDAPKLLEEEVAQKLVTKLQEELS